MTSTIYMYIIYNLLPRCEFYFFRSYILPKYTYIYIYIYIYPCYEDRPHQRRVHVFLLSSFFKLCQTTKLQQAEWTVTL